MVAFVQFAASACAKCKPKKKKNKLYDQPALHCRQHNRRPSQQQRLFVVYVHAFLACEKFTLGALAIFQINNIKNRANVKYGHSTNSKLYIRSSNTVYQPNKSLESSAFLLFLFFFVVATSLLAYPSIIHPIEESVSA